MKKKIFQSRLHRPASGQYGDCHRACYATILGVDLWEIPHFYDEGRDHADALPIFHELWKRFGIREITNVYDGSADLSILLRTSEHFNPGIPFILGGMSRNLTNHSVVAWKGEIWHDPSLDQSGIIGPMKPDGHWWSTYILRELPWMSSRRQRPRKRGAAAGAVAVAGDDRGCETSSAVPFAVG